MKTITFYSYKGGVGRTLAVANVARYLASFGQKVFAIDLDLEAPGLHYKLAPAAERKEVTAGVVDVVASLLTEKEPPRGLAPYVVRVDHRTDAGGSIHLMPAGHVPSAPYWRKLAQLSWHDLFYAEGARGIPFFLELKERIAREFEPDFLLIDARSGITELGGVATTLLPDQVVCLLANNPESLDGARAVLRGIRRTPRLPGQDPVEILPLVARIPKGLDEDVEERLLERVRAFLSEPADDLADTLTVPEVFVLHSEPELQVTEAIRVGSDQSPDDSPLLRDYLRLFMRMFPAVIEPRLAVQVDAVIASAMEDPDRAQRRLEALAGAFPHAVSYRALLQFYRLRQVDPGKLLRMAHRYWELTGRADDSLLLEIASAYEWEGKGTVLPWFAEFFADIFRAQPEPDPTFGIKIANLYLQSAVARREERALEILRRLTQGPDAPEAAVVEEIRLLRRLGKHADALALAERYKGPLGASAELQSAWADAAVATEDPKLVQALLDAPGFKIDLVRQARPTVWWSMLTLLGSTEGGQGDLDAALVDHTRKFGVTRELVEVGHLYRQLGRLQLFENTVRMLIKDKDRVEGLLAGVLREPKRGPGTRPHG
ncbi:MAG TPA: AAA family ATPase [Polyangiaceae bacterium]|jgi:hypothetical protein|nr:AAA family ATPase [Polyangiaceae bacterium]